MLVNAIWPFSSLTQNSEMTVSSAIRRNTALIASRSIPAFRAASTKWAASVASATMCFETASSAAG